MARAPRVVPFGEAALLVELGDVIDEETHARILALRTAIEADPAGFAGVRSTVPAYGTLLVTYDPDATDAEELRTRLEAVLRGPLRPTHAAGEVVEDRGVIDVAVRYGGGDGADLKVVAEQLGMHADDVVAAHTERIYRVYLLGFAPGFAYLGTLVEALHLPRRSEPRVRVPAGSVAIAGAQTAVYPFSTAGGWHLIGATDMRMWDLDRSPPATLRPGDRVRFMAI